MRRFQIIIAILIVILSLGFFFLSLYSTATAQRHQSDV